MGTAEGINADVEGPARGEARHAIERLEDVAAAPAPRKNSTPIFGREPQFSASHRDALQGMTARWRPPTSRGRTAIDTHAVKRSRCGNEQGTAIEGETVGAPFAKSPDRANATVIAQYE